MLIFLKKEDGIVEQKKEQNLLMNMTGTHLEKKKRNDKVLVSNKDMLCSCTILSPGLESNIQYDNFRDCAIAGYTQAHEIILSMPPAQVEETQTLIKFYCIKKETEVAPFKRNSYLGVINISCYFF